MSQFNVHQFMCRSDNYGVIIHDPRTMATASIDAPDANAVEQELKRLGIKLTDIFTTHHHDDHVAGNLRLKEMYGCKIIGPKGEADRIPGIDVKIGGGEKFEWAGREIKVFDCPGHTRGHIAYYIAAENLLFAGDTVFAMGCGRVIEGTMSEMWHSVNQFAALPPATMIYCGHEYTEANGRFALSVEPGNAALRKRTAHVASQRARNEMTCPASLADELQTNPFMRCGSAEIRKNLALERAADAEVFAELRTRKNNF
jgi:hydroxyacylglutathione hydrolase